MNNDWLDLAVQAIREQDITRAHELLAGYVRCNTEDAGGWVWLSRITDQREAKLEYLEHALELNPYDHDALDDWESLSKKRQVIAPMRRSKWSKPKRHRAEKIDLASKKNRVAVWRLTFMIGVAMACLAVGWAALTMF